MSLRSLHSHNSLHSLHSLIIFLSIILLTSCYGGDGSDPHVNAVYYWTTTFQRSQPKHDFMERTGVKRLYMRFFDVVMSEEGRPVPNATIEFLDTIPQDMEVIPVVYILNDCMEQPADSLAPKIAKRIRQMCQTHDVPNVHEIQIDCDWTRRTQSQYFKFLSQLRQKLKADSLGLSATIRLHQLSMDPPPTDRGILMVYNTGDVTDRNCRNPILDIDDVRPFMKYLKDYPLPLSAAYPIFSWDVIFRGDRFIGIQHFEGEYPLMPGDTIITYRPTKAEVIEVEKLIDHFRSDCNEEVILFDLSDKNLE